MILFKFQVLLHLYKIVLVASSNVMGMDLPKSRFLKTLRVSSILKKYLIQSLELSEEIGIMMTPENILINRT